MLPRNAILGGVALVIVAFYWKLWNVRVFKEHDVLLQQLQGSYRPATEPVVLMLGRSFFFIATAAWVVLSLQTLVQGYQRARYRPKITQPLQPLSPDAARQQEGSTNNTTAPSTSQKLTKLPKPSTTSGPSAAAASAPQQQQQQQQGDWREQRRLQALEAAQRALDEKAAELKLQQQQEEEARKARKAQAAEAAAKQQAEKAAAEAAARAAAVAAAEAAAQAAAEARAAFAAAAAAQWHGLAPPTPVNSDSTSIPGANTTAAAGPAAGLDAAGGGSGVPAAANPAAAALDRSIRQQQDMEYQQSLERDRAKAAAKAAQRKADAAASQLQARQQRLAALRQHLQHKLTPEPPLTNNDSDTAPLTLRVRLPGGGTASRRFGAGHAFDEVFAWVFSLPEMQLWAPGTWALVSGFPRRQLMPPADSTWAPGVWEQQQQQQQGGGGGRGEMLLPGEWMLRVDRLEQAALWVKVHEESTLADVQEEIEAQTGIPQQQQRLIFAGHILQSPRSTLQQLNISTGHRLQLAGHAGPTAAAGSSSGGGAGGSSSGGGGGGGGSQNVAGSGSGVDPDSLEAAERAKEVGRAAEQAYLGAGDVLVLGNVGELQDQVAHGAAQLALYVEALPTQEL